MIGLTVVGDMGEIFPNFFMTLSENECLRIFQGINNNRNAFEYFFCNTLIITLELGVSV